MSLTVEDAQDIIDVYGPSRKRSPPSEVPAMDALLQSDKELAEYLKRQRTIDSLLNKWKEDDDGALVEEDEDPVGESDLDDLDDDRGENYDEEERDSPGGADDDEDEDDGPAPPAGDMALPPIDLDPDDM